jgi:hypothetical protein
VVRSRTTHLWRSVAWLCSPSRDPAAARSETGPDAPPRRQAETSKRPPRRNRSEPGCVSVTIGRARHALRNSARLSPLRNKRDASLPPRASCPPASASFRPLAELEARRRESRQRFVWIFRDGGSSLPPHHRHRAISRT